MDEGQVFWEAFSALENRVWQRGGLHHLMSLTVDTGDDQTEDEDVKVLHE